MFRILILLFEIIVALQLVGSMVSKKLVVGSIVKNDALSLYVTKSYGKMIKTQGFYMTLRPLMHLKHA